MHSARVVSFFTSVKTDPGVSRSQKLPRVLAGTVVQSGKRTQEAAGALITRRALAGLTRVCSSALGLASAAAGVIRGTGPGPQFI